MVSHDGRYVITYNGDVYGYGALRALWNGHIDGRRNHQHLLWDSLMLEAWRARWKPPPLQRHRLAT